MMRIGSVNYSLNLASDLTRDGMILEVWDESRDERALVAEVFYSDATAEVTFAAHQELPFELVEHLAANARRRLTPVADKTKEAVE